MFTGIVTELGSVTELVDADGVVSLSVGAPRTSDGLVIGDSIAVKISGTGALKSSNDIPEPRIQIVGV